MQCKAFKTTLTELDRACWLSPSALRLLPLEVHVWEFSLAVPDSTVVDCSKRLSADEQQRATRFHFAADRSRFTVARGALRTTLTAYTGTPPESHRFTYSKHGKPRLESQFLDIRFNLSHSGERAVIGVTLGREIGVDIEQVRENVEIDSLAERFFSVGEREFMRGLPHEKKLGTFFRYWTCKEAFLKAQAVGLARSLASFTVDLSGRHPSLVDAYEPSGEELQWSLEEIECNPGYAAALAVEGSIAGLRIFRQK